jgi:hypothetical protein
MSKVSPFSPFRMEDFPTERDWIGKLFLPLNTILTQVGSALNADTSFGDNIPTFTKVIAGSNLSLPQKFQFVGSFSPTQMVIAQATKDGVPIAMAGAWSISGDTITVNKLYEIDATGNIPIANGPKYSIVLRFN